ncbi:MAG: AAA family ATPase [Bacteroidota bacterium]|nr:AAA family ATPase [Bacteroidota bacterium]
MHWTDIINQRKVIDLLQRALESGRVAHAYLFHGPDGVGKRAVALALARAMQCEGCSETLPCAACLKVMRFEHPDVDYYMPQPTDAAVEAVAERIQLLARNNYAFVDFVRSPVIEGLTPTASNKQALYTIDRINSSIRRVMVRRPREGHCRMAIITDADALQTQAANAFLKLLEEPGPQTCFVLTTSRPDVLLPTILSRCQKIMFAPLSQDTIRDALIRQLSLAESEAQTAAILADGSYSRALELARNSELQVDRENVLLLFRLAWTGRIRDQAALVEDLSGASREHLKNQFSLMLSWVRDAVLFREIQEDAPVLNRDQLPQLKRFCMNLPNADLEAMARLIQRARDLVEFRVQPRLIIIALIQSLGQAMRGPLPDTLAEPLTQVLPAR